LSEWIIEAESLEEIPDGNWTIGRKLVRCDDCFHSRPDEYGLECMVHYRPTKEDDFCSYGVKVTE